MEETQTKHSELDYKNFKETGNQNLFEEVIDSLMMNKYSDDQELNDYIKTLPREQKRIALLTVLDGTNNQWVKLKELVDNKKSITDNIKEIILMLREFVKVGEVEKKKYGEVMTPLELVKDMLSTLPGDVWTNPNLKWLDPANGSGPFPIMVIYKLMEGLKDWEPDEEKRYKHIVENMIYTCELQDRNVFLWLCAVDLEDKYTTNTYWGSFLDEGFDKHMKEVWNVEKFDVIMGNPPYNQIIDLEFLTKSYNISDKVLFVHPSTWLLDEKNKQKKFIKAKDLIKDHLVSIKLFNGNGIFGISLFVPCVITYINKYNEKDGIYCVDEINKVKLTYDNIYQINKFGDKDIYLKLKNKFQNLPNKLGTLEDHKKKDGNYFINVAGIRGNVNRESENIMIKDDFYTFFPKNLYVETIKDVKKEFFGFETESEATSFLNFLKLNIPRFLLSIYKNNQHINRKEMDLIPWLDFTQEWTDEKLYKHFNITEDEIKFIEKHIPKYY